MSAQGSSLCENSNAELARRKFVSITLNRKEQHWQSQSKQEKGENNSAHSLLAHVFTQVRRETGKE
jgi:beta-xylosidase